MTLKSPPWASLTAGKSFTKQLNVDTYNTQGRVDICERPVSPHLHISIDSNLPPKENFISFQKEQRYRTIIVSKLLGK